jgi:zinc transporter
MGGGKPLDWSGVIEQPVGQGMLWVDIDFMTPKSRKWLRSLSDVPNLALEKLMTRETRPNTVPFGNGLLIILRGVNLNPGSDVEDMISIRVWIDNHRIITCRQRELQSVQALAGQIARGDGPHSAGELVISLVGELANRIRQTIQNMEDMLTDFEAHPRGANQSAESVYSDLRRRSAVLRRHLNPQRDALARLQGYQGELLGLAERNDLQIHTDTIIHSIEDLEVMREHTQALQDELFSKMARDQNERMYMLTVVAAIFLPLTFISGLLGMNVGGIPWGSSPVGFWGIVGICVSIVGVMLVYFRSKRWL